MKNQKLIISFNHVDDQEDLDKKLDFSKENPEIFAEFIEFLEVIMPFGNVLVDVDTATIN